MSMVSISAMRLAPSASQGNDSEQVDAERRQSVVRRELEVGGSCSQRDGAGLGHAMLILQRTAGNRAVSQLLRSGQLASARNGQEQAALLYSSGDETAPGILIQRQQDDSAALPASPGAANDIETVDSDVNAEQSAAEEERFDEEAEQAALAEQPSIWHDILEGAAGVAYGTTQSLTPGGFLAPSPAPRSRLFEFFRGAGQTATGIAEMAGGVGGEVGGVALDATGVGAVAGVPLNIASAAVIAQGGVSTAAGVKTLLHAMSMQGGSSSGAPRLPAKGTPQRAALENARRSGIRAAQRRELENIKAGGKGTSGNQVWSDAELQQIRQTGQFPKDVRWHHSPTVANRPDLAGDPSVIRPVRGGVQGHLAAHGGDFRK